MEKKDFPLERWKAVLSDAYWLDRESREIMVRFNERLEVLKAEGRPVEADPEAMSLYESLIFTVRAFAEGRPAASGGDCTRH